MPASCSRLHIELCATTAGVAQCRSCASPCSPQLCCSLPAPLRRANTRRCTRCGSCRARTCAQNYSATSTRTASRQAGSQSCAGSLTDFNLRFADQPNGSTGHGHFEIVSLSGTLSTHGSHLHLAIADEQGRTIGGHLLDGCRIYTTAEIVLGASLTHVFVRERCGSTPWEELQVLTR